MKVQVKDFYAEVTGAERSTAKMVADLGRWKIPMSIRGEGNGARKHHSVDIAHLEEAKAKWELDKAQGLDKVRAAPGRGATEQKLDDVISRLKGIEIALNALMKLAKS